MTHYSCLDTITNTVSSSSSIVCIPKTERYLPNMKTILIAACLFLFAALAMGQTTQTVDVSPTANYAGDAVGTFIGEPTIAGSNGTISTSK